MDDSNRVKLFSLQGRGLTVDASLLGCRERKVVCTPWSGLALTLALASAAVDFAISLPKLYHLFSQALRRCCSFILSVLFFSLCQRLSHSHHGVPAGSFLKAGQQQSLCCHASHRPHCFFTGSESSACSRAFPRQVRGAWHSLRQSGGCFPFTPCFAA